MPVIWDGRAPRSRSLEAEQLAEMRMMLDMWGCPCERSPRSTPSCRPPASPNCAPTLAPVSLRPRPTPLLIASRSSDRGVDRARRTSLVARRAGQSPDQIAPNYMFAGDSDSHPHAKHHPGPNMIA